MAILRPAITGDIVQDSWADQVTRALNTATLTGGGGIGGTGGGSGTGPAGVDGFNTATLYLFARSTSDSMPPDSVALETTYVYGSGILTDSNGNTGDPALNDPISTNWFRAIPDENLGEFIWATVVNIADQEDAETIAPNSWSQVTLLARPGQDAVTVTVEARSPDNSSADWVSLSNTSDASPNFRNDSAKVIGLVIRIYEAGTEVIPTVYTDATTSYVWTKNGEDFTPNETQVTGTGKDMRVLLINEKDVADNNFNEVFTCRIDY